MRTFLLVMLTACAAPRPLGALGEPGAALALAYEDLSEGGLRARRAPPDDADLVLFYGGEHLGSLETCGCPKRPRGSLARAAGYIEASRAPGSLLVNAGYWLEDTIGLDGGLRADVQLMDRWMIEGLEAGGWQALNVTYRDLPYLESADAMPAAAVSANVTATTGPGPAPFRVFDVAGVRVAVTGVTRNGATFLLPERFAIGDPVAALAEVVPRMAAEAEVVVVLGFEVGTANGEIARIPGVDVLIEADSYRARFEPFVEGHTVWVRSHYQTMRLGELRLKLHDGAVVAALDRKIDLDSRIPGDPRLERLTRRARREIDLVQREVFAP